MKRKLVDFTGHKFAIDSSRRLRDMDLRFVFSFDRIRRMHGEIVKFADAEYTYMQNYCKEASNED